MRNGQELRRRRTKVRRKRGVGKAEGTEKAGPEAFGLLSSSNKSSFPKTLWVYLAAKPIHHQEDQCLRLKVTVNGKITHSPQAHANPQEKRLPADDPEVQVLHSIGHSAAPRLFPLAWAVLLLPLLLLQTH